MRFLLDESAEYRLVSFLRDQGYDVTAIAHDFPHALTDREMLEIARLEERILITNDRDFGELIVRELLPHAGVIYFRLPAAAVQRNMQRLGDVLKEYRGDLSRGLVVGEHDVRIR